ncbi:MAG: DUF5672 family protein [Minisyncoccia bacterium]
MKRKLENVTLLGIDCLDLDRLIQVAEICQKDFEFAEVKLLSSIKSDHPNVIPINEIKSVEEYSRFAIAEIDKYVSTTHVLIIQYDGFILNPDAWTDEFLEYDYIGSPWLVSQKLSVNVFGFPEKLVGKFVVGNGGFSLRSKKLTSLCAELAHKNFFTKYHPEDVVLCVKNRKFLEDSGIKFAPVPLAQRFSFEAESEEKYTWDGQFGFHSLNWTDISKWLKKNPNYNIKNTIRVKMKIKKW